ncbi:hypothetical protein KPN8_251 [Klebsiella phage KPN8]|nr:hypothetical protein KPN8_251 [Klebsiella phage KPN8]
MDNFHLAIRDLGPVQKIILSVRYYFAIKSSRLDKFNSL